MKKNLYLAMALLALLAVGCASCEREEGGSEPVPSQAEAGDRSPVEDISPEVEAGSPEVEVTSAQVVIQSPAEGAIFEANEAVVLRYQTHNMANGPSGEEVAVIVYLDGAQIAVSSGEPLGDLSAGSHLLEIRLADGSLLDKVDFRIEEPAKPPAEAEREEIAIKLLNLVNCYPNYWGGEDVLTPPYVIRSQADWEKFQDDYRCGRIEKIADDHPLASISEDRVVRAYYQGATSSERMAPNANFSDRMFVLFWSRGIVECEPPRFEIRAYREKGKIYVVENYTGPAQLCDATGFRVYTFAVEMEKSDLPVHRINLCHGDPEIDPSNYFVDDCGQ